MSPAPHPVSRGCVLAGGRSSRMGEDKAMLPWRGRPLVEHAVALLRSTGLTPSIASNRTQFAEYAPVVHDRHPGCGPLAGIEAALAALPDEGSGAAHMLFLPVDLPLLPTGFIRLLADRVERTGALATVPVLGGRCQPLCAIYARTLLPGIDAALRNSQYKVMRVIEELTHPGERDFFRVEAVTNAHPIAGPDEAELPVYRWFANANTPADWAALQPVPR